VKAWLRHHRQSLTGTLRRLLRTPGATLLNVISIAVALALPLGAWVSLSNAERLGGNLMRGPQLAVFLAKDASRSDAARVEAALGESSTARRIRFVSKDDALAELKRSEAVAEITAALGGNPLPDAFIVELNPSNPAGAERLAAEVGKLPKVALVQLDAVWVKRLDALLRIGSTLVIILAVLLGVGMVAVTFNTIRLQILTQREEIELIRLIGGTDAFIRRPLLYQGALVGIAAGLVALGLVQGAVHALNAEVAQLAATYGSSFRLVLPATGDLLAVLGIAAALGWIGSYLSVSRHLYFPTRPR
jgi:cell division transport system permease protein